MSFKGKKLSPERRKQVHRLRKWQKRTRTEDATDRNLALALSEVNRMASQSGLPSNVQEITAEIYRKAVEKGLIRGRSIEGVLSAVLYAACREAQVPRTLEEVAEVSRVDKKEISSSHLERHQARNLDSLLRNERRIPGSDQERVQKNIKQNKLRQRMDQQIPPGKFSKDLHLTIKTNITLTKNCRIMGVEKFQNAAYVAEK